MPKRHSGATVSVTVGPDTVSVRVTVSVSVIVFVTGSESSVTVTCSLSVTTWVGDVSTTVSVFVFLWMTVRTCSTVVVAGGSYRLATPNAPAIPATPSATAPAATRAFRSRFFMKPRGPFPPNGDGTRLDRGTAPLPGHLEFCSSPLPDKPQRGTVLAPATPSPTGRRRQSGFRQSLGLIVAAVPPRSWPFRAAVPLTERPARAACRPARRLPPPRDPDT